jgi:hypothetical protein
MTDSDDNYAALFGVKGTKNNILYSSESETVNVPVIKRCDPYFNVRLIYIRVVVKKANRERKKGSLG